MEDPGQKAAPCLAPPVPRKLRTGQALSFIGICLVLLLTLMQVWGFALGAFVLRATLTSRVVTAARVRCVRASLFANRVCEILFLFHCSAIS